MSLKFEIESLSVNNIIDFSKMIESICLIYKIIQDAPTNTYKTHQIQICEPILFRL